MIIGVGVDIIEISRIKDAVENNSRFLEEVYTEREIEYFKSKNYKSEHMAGRFAAKEAVSKALGTGIRGFGLKDIETDRDDMGKPYVALKGKAKEKAESFGNYRLHISISHNNSDAIAYAILEIYEN